MADQRNGDLPAPRMDYPDDEDHGAELIGFGVAAMVVAVVWFFIGFAIGRITG